MSNEDILDSLTSRFPNLRTCRDNILTMYGMLVNCFDNGKRLYICGNGGSAADALHIVGELTKSFLLSRPLEEDFVKAINDESLIKNLQGGLPAQSLVENSALSTAFSNDVNPEYTFAQQVYIYARIGDCVMGISTSGNSKNIIYALKVARARGATTLALTGGDGGIVKELCDCTVVVPETETYRIQELHLPVYHALCIMLERRFWGID